MDKEDNKNKQDITEGEDNPTIEPLTRSEYSSDDVNLSADNKTNKTNQEPSLSDEVVMVLQEKTGWVCNGSVCTDLGPIYDRQTPSDGNVSLSINISCNI